MTENNILAMHEALLSSQRGWEEYAGAYRTNLVWVGTDSYSPRGAAHVGPQSELIADAKTDLLEFIKHDDLPVVAQCAITYAQFETIILRVSRLKNEVHFNSDITSRIKNDLTRLYVQPVL